ncbi:hypothetical protein SIN09_08705 [Streptomyces sp. F8]|uniref:hypothetical protein n=1 Tax=Streptomyces sp. F8 TaxID=1436085 RepID=UPI0029D366A3|nr:hypothetical protein [Streptomyces sp. F8]MDX6759520.1 hypothetical protein [Streptomyces sp. F8]
MRVWAGAPVCHPVRTGPGCGQNEVSEYMALAQEQGHSLPRFGTCTCGYHPTMPND